MASYADIIKRNREISAVKWWPNFAYHFTDVMNAAGILSSGVLYSRIEAENENRMINNNASGQVINVTSDAGTVKCQILFPTSDTDAVLQ